MLTLSPLSDKLNLIQNNEWKSPLQLLYYTPTHHLVWSKTMNGRVHCCYSVLKSWVFSRDQSMLEASINNLLSWHSFMKYSKIFFKIGCILHILSLNPASLTGIGIWENLFCKQISWDNHVLRCILLWFLPKPIGTYHIRTRILIIFIETKGQIMKVTKSAMGTTVLWCIFWNCFWQIFTRMWYFAMHKSWKQRKGTYNIDQYWEITFNWISDFT